VEQRYSVLVADDDSACRESLRALLEAEGLRTFLADCGVEALECVHNNLIHLLILDQYMPDIKGVDTLKRIIEIKRRIPSIIISGENTKETKMEALNAGAFAFISKPIQTGIMKHAVHQVIDRYYLQDRRRDTWRRRL
jgi:DNA-binding NtrC family response regulator